MEHEALGPRGQSAYKANGQSAHYGGPELGYAERHNSELIYTDEHNPYQMGAAVEADPSGSLLAKGSRLVNVGGAIVSLALIVGLGVWGYRSVVRDVSGVPVVRALEGPMRIAPDNPGGEVVGNTGLAVNEVAAEGGATEQQDQIVLAPGPVELTEEDLPLAVLTADAASGERGIGEISRAGQQGETDPFASEQESAPQISEAVDAEDPVAAALAELVAEDSAEARLAALPGVKRSLVPPRRPVGLRRSVSTAQSTAASASVSRGDVRIVSSGAIPAGTRLVQLGAFDTPEDAAGQWLQLRAKFGALMLEKTQVIMKAESGGRIFYRLRAQGFADLSDARRFCAALVAEKADCIPVVSR